MSPIEKWDSAAVVSFAGKILAERIETACKFVEVEARNNLNAITEPEWGRAYRTQIVGRLLTSGVIIRGKTIDGYVGVRTRSGKGGDRHGYYIELGSRTAPAHPWLRPALFNNLPHVRQMILGAK